MKCEDLERVVVGDDSEIFFQVGAPLSKREQLVKFLRKKVDVFAWDAYEAPGVDPNFICHHLNVNLPLLRRDSLLAVCPKNMLGLSEMR